MAGDFIVQCNSTSGAIASIQLYGKELLVPENPGPELYVNDLPLNTHLYPHAEKAIDHPESKSRFWGERYVNHFSGWRLWLDLIN